jgi:MFS family permease
MERPQTARLRFRFTRLAWANLGAQSAEQIGVAAATLFAVLGLGAGAGEIGTLQTVQTLPYLLLSIPAGVLADRVSKRRLMTVARRSARSPWRPCSPSSSPAAPPSPCSR